MSKKSQTLLPVSSNLLHPKVVEHFKDKLKYKRQKAKNYHGRGAKVLLELDIGQVVRNAGQWDKNWQLGTVSPTQFKSMEKSFTKTARVDMRSKHNNGEVEDTPDLHKAEEDLLIGGPPTLISAPQSKTSVKVSDQTNTSIRQTTTGSRTLCKH